MSKHIIPIFFALDERFLKYGIVSLYSLRENAKSGNTYKLWQLCLASGAACSSFAFLLGAGSIEIDDSQVDYSTPGIYKVHYACDNRQEYYGYTVLIVIVTEVAR